MSNRRMSKGGIAALCLFYKNGQYDSNSKLVFPLLLVRGDFIKSIEFLPSTFDILLFCGSTVRCFFFLPSISTLNGYSYIPSNTFQ